MGQSRSAVSPRHGIALDQPVVVVAFDLWSGKKTSVEMPQGANKLQISQLRPEQRISSFDPHIFKLCRLAGF
jgi:hypothetical protein